MLILRTFVMVVSINARASGYFGDHIQVTKMAVTRNFEFDSSTKFSIPKLLSVGFTLNSTSLQPGSYILNRSDRCAPQLYR